MILIKKTGNEIVGKLIDGDAQYSISAIAEGTVLQGTANHLAYEIKADITGRLIQNKLSLTLNFNMNGTVNVAKIELDKVKIINHDYQDTKSRLPVGAMLDPRLIGKWTKEENYNSGSGNEFMGASFSQSILFNADGTLSEGGRQASISGNDFLGQSKSINNTAVSGVLWYTLNSQIYLIIHQNTSDHEIVLGKYFIEGSNMLISGSNGVKMLMHKN